jgi:regulator of sirC expression with transglutaminase-like and TPR domain
MFQSTEARRYSYLMTDNLSLQLVLSALKLDRTNPALLRQAGTVYYELFCEEAALQMFQKLVELYPDNVEDKKSLATIQRTISKHYTCRIYQ